MEAAVGEINYAYKKEHIEQNYTKNMLLQVTELPSKS
jgi:hypothetical protein